MKDTANEKKFDVNLAESLDRAHKLRGKLFAGKTFYFTPKIPIDAKLLKNVVLACGGQVGYSSLMHSCILIKPLRRSSTRHPRCEF